MPGIETNIWNVKDKWVRETAENFIKQIIQSFYDQEWHQTSYLGDYVRLLF